MHDLDIIVAGDVNLDIIPSSFNGVPKMGQELFVDSMAVTIGGSAANTAIGLAKLGLKVALFSVVSDDQFGRYIMEELEGAGVSTSLMEVTSEANTGISICLTSGKDRAFISYMGNNNLYQPEKLLEKKLNTRHIHVAGFNWQNLIDGYVHLVTELKTKGLSVSLDVGYDDYEQYWDKMHRILAGINLFFPNETEARKLTGEKDVYKALDKLSAVVPVAVITRGSMGAIAKDQGQIWHQPAFKVDAVDAVGAGDAFDAGFLYGYLRDLSTSQCLKLGSACGAMAASSYGGGAAAPGIAELEDFLIKHCGKSEALKSEVG
ncbi:MAG: carbohydrate kinase family protein [Bacillota bacterium]|nr:carbohydrate kinase family protein [Bacillota bacterium]